MNIYSNLIMFSENLNDEILNLLYGKYKVFKNGTRREDTYLFKWPTVVKMRICVVIDTHGKMRNWVLIDRHGKTRVWVVKG